MSTPPTKTPDLTQRQVAELSPAQRDAYFQRKADEGVDKDNWLFGVIQTWLASGKAKQQSTEVGDKNVKDLTTGRDVEYVKGLKPSDADYLGHEHTQLKGYLDQNLNVEQVSNVSNAYFDVHKAFEQFATTMTEAVNKSKGTWEGAAAGNAQAYFTSLGKWADANSQNAKLASETTYDQGTAAATAKNSMPKPIPFSWGDEFKSWMTSNPFNLGDNIDKSVQKQQDSNKAHEDAARVMSSYDKQLYEAASKQPVFAEPPKFSVGGGGKTEPSDSDKNKGGGNNNGNINIPGGNNFSGNTGGGGSGGGGSSIPGGSVNIPGGGSSIPSAPGSITGSGHLPVGSGTAPSGYVPPSPSLPAPNNANTAMPMGMGPMPMGMGPMGGMGGENEYNSKVGRGGGFGPGGGSGSTPGAGAGSGAARPGGIGAAETAAGRGMGGLGSGAGGRGGMGPGGMGGARGQHGEGDEDTEHQRPTYLVEGDPDEVFGTDMRTAPPVIGE
ncbi:hypothetical protein ACFWY9_16430 [Amycolatopsis sp. NPDC059027]|uniref:hypothetical protein n=1 Tax=unclassified Amycolatopsis TaxID=2618356 RepID=UPI00366AA8A9